MFVVDAPPVARLTVPVVIPVHSLTVPVVTSVVKLIVPLVVLANFNTFPVIAPPIVAVVNVAMLVPRFNDVPATVTLLSTVNPFLILKSAIAILKILYIFL